MHFRIIVAGKPALAYAKAGIEEYLKRLTRHGSYELITVKAGASDEVSARLLEKSQGCHRIALDERGVAMDTRGFSQHLASLEQRGGIKAVALLIGASDGHNDGLRKTADLLLSVSGFTLQHELATVVLLEQLYRVAMLKSGAPYHRD